MRKELNLRKDRQGEKGFSLLELLLVVGVGALLLLAGIGTYQLVTSGNTSNEAVRLLTTIKTQTQRAFQGQPNYGAAGANLLPVLISMQAFPSGVVDPAAGTATDPWGQAIAITSQGNNFDIAFPLVPSAACIQIGSAFNVSDTDFVQLNVGGTVFNITTAGGITAAGLQGACGTNAQVAMTWTFF